MKYFVILVLVLIMAGGGYAWWNSHEKDAAAAAAAAAPVTVKVERKDIRVEVQSNGAVASNRDVDIKCKASGNIQKLPYTDVSAEVAPDGLLMQLDPIDQQRSLDQAMAVVSADEATVNEAKLAYQIAQLNLVTTRQKTVAALAYAKAKAADARSKANRTKELFDQNLDSKEDLETAETAAASADADVQTADAAVKELDQQALAVQSKQDAITEATAQLTQDKAKLDTAKLNVGYCTVTAPSADDPTDPPKWRISAITAGISVGYLVQSGSSGTSGGTTVMTLSDLSHIYILATVDESDIGKLLTKFGAGQELPVAITADAYPGVTFTGKVVRIATKGVNTTNVVTFEVKIEVTSDNRSLLRPIMTTNVTITTSDDKDVLTLPVNAVSRHRADDATTQSASTQMASADGTTTEPAATQVASADASSTDHPKRGNGQHRHKKKDDGSGDSRPTPGTVQILKADGSIEPREVMVGLTDGVSYEILSGVSEGDVVVTNRMDADSQWRNRGGGGGNRGGMMGFRR